MATMETDVVGRDPELRVVGGFLDRLPSGSGVLLAEGEPGIGKTTVWLAGRDGARRLGYRVLWCRPIQTETPLAFVALADLLEPVLDEAFPQLPSPQARALEVAMLRAEAGVRQPDRRAVCAAVLGVIRSLAASRPVLLAIDDVQWLDRPTARVLEFVIRRLAEHPVGVLLTSRTGEQAPRDLDRLLPPGHLLRLTVGPLSVGSVQAILRRQLGAAFSRPLLLRIHQASGGNPLFALEIAREIEARGGELRRGEPLPVPDALGDAVRARLARLSVRVRRRLLVVALLAQPTVGLVEEVFADPERVRSDLDQASHAGVIQISGDGIQFTHPLLAAAAICEATPEQRRRLHWRLANTTADSEERARHLSLATVRPDAGVAGLLDAAARAARARGAPEVAAELSEEACRLTPRTGAAQLARRRLDAADHYYAAGESGRARKLLEAVVEASPSPTDRAEALLRLGILHYHADDQLAAVALLEQAREDSGDDLNLRSEIEQHLSWAVSVAGDIPRGAEHARLALQLAEQRQDAGALSRALAMVAIINFFLGGGVDTRMMQRSLALEEWTEALPVEWRPSFLHGYMLKQTSQLRAAREVLEDVRSRLEAQGDEAALPFILSSLSELECWAGNLERAAEYAELGHTLAIQTGQGLTRAFLLSSRARVHALRGEIERARSLAEEGLVIAERGRLYPPIQFNTAVLAFVDLSVGDHATVHARLGPLADRLAGVGMAEPGILRFVPDEVEALVALGEVERAASILDVFQARAAALHRIWSLATAARCRGLVEAARGTAPTAIGALEAALQYHQDVGEPFELARTLLVAGQLYRRNRQKRASKQALERALEIFERLGTPLWAAKARAELARVGIRPSAPLGLTPTEERVAQLVADGKTNSEVAAELFLSRRTVEDNLSRIYRKLGVRSRAQLARSYASGNASR
ncbi:MAG TPA: AAA family ATPase [Actinomycetes bacterium]